MYFSGGIEISFAASPVGATDLGLGGGVIKTIFADSPRGKLEIPIKEDGLLTAMNLNSKGNDPTTGKVKIVGGEEAVQEMEKQSSSPVTPSTPLPGDEFAPIYYFGNYGEIDPSLPKGRAQDKKLLGGKGANLAEMANLISQQFPELGLNVPPGFTLTTEQTKNWNNRKRILSPKLRQEMMQAMVRLEKATGRKLGDTENIPLLIAVRSGAEKSMAGMMDTILNLGLNDKSVLTLAKWTNEWFAWDSYRRFIEMFGRTVLGVREDDEKRTGFKHILKEMIDRKNGRKSEYELSVVELKELVELYKEEIKRQGLEKIPKDPYEQYFQAVDAVFRSTFNERAMTYRAKEGYKLEETLSAANVQAMVFGNLNEKSGAGVAFSRDLQTGERRHNLEFNILCQGEDVVAGRKKGLPLEELQRRFPEAAQTLEKILDVLEQHYQDVQDVEFTIENGKLWILQARSAKRTSRAEIKTAMDMYAEGLLKTKEEVLKLITPEKMVELLVPQFNKEAKKEALKEERLLSDVGLNASPGAAVGRIVFDSETAKELKEKINEIRTRINNNEIVSKEEIELARLGVILVREETSPEDLDGMLASVGIWTQKGGRTSHAAVVARGFGIPAVVGDENIEINLSAKTVTVRKADGTKQVLKAGDIVSLDGTGDKGKGQIFAGEIKTEPSLVTAAQFKENPEPVKKAIETLKAWRERITGEDAAAFQREYDGHIKTYKEHIAEFEKRELTEEEWKFYRHYQTLRAWADKFRKDQGGLGVGANAEKPLDVFNAVLNGAQNFGLVRTEHMFSGDRRELRFQKMILAKTKEERKQALAELLPLQQVDFEQIIIFADGRPVTIRLIDPPLHEFLPKKEQKIQELAADTLRSIEDVKQRIEDLREENPMFATRGGRLSVLYPEIIEMQTRAIFNAVKHARSEGIQIKPEIMVPLIGNVKEFRFVKERIERVAKESGIARDSFLIGTMIEIVAGAMNIAEIAKEVEFISFGTNDLTQGVLKISRDDGKEWLRQSLAAEIFEDDPFETLSPEVALFVKRVIEQARAANPKIKIGICGEQGVDIKSIRKHLARFGLDYVSGGARRIPGALMAAAQESLKPAPQPLAPEARVDKISIEKRDLAELPEIKKVETLANQFHEAVAYVESQGNTPEAKRLALANIDLTKPVDANIKSKPDYQTVLSWAKELKHLNVLIRTDKSIENYLIRMIDTEPAFFSQELRFEIQKFLLDRDISVSKRQSKMEIFRDYFVAYIKGIAGTNQTLSVKLPDLALGTIFEYETEEEQEQAIRDLSTDLGIEREEVKAGIVQYREANPAIGTRGMRVFFLRNVAPLYIAIAQAALKAAKELGLKTAEIILPFLVNGKELEVILAGYKTEQGQTIVFSLREALKVVEGTEGINYRFGAVIETPAACVTAQDLSRHADFFVVDAKKLTESVWAAFEKDTRKGFLVAYLANGIWDDDIFKYTPIETRLLIQEAVSRARIERRDLEVRVITDSQDTNLIELAEYLGINSLIVSLLEVDIATLAAAQAAITIIRPITFGKAASISKEISWSESTEDGRLMTSSTSLTEESKANPESDSTTKAGSPIQKLIDEFANAVVKEIELLKIERPDLGQIDFFRDQKRWEKEKEVDLILHMVYQKEGERGHVGHLWYNKRFGHGVYSIQYQFEDLSIEFENLFDTGLIDKITVKPGQTKEEIKQNIITAINKTAAASPLIDEVTEILKKGPMTSKEIIDSLPLQDSIFPQSVGISKETVLEKVEEALNNLIKEGKVIKELPGESPAAKKAQKSRERLESLERQIESISRGMHLTRDGGEYESLNTKYKELVEERDVVFNAAEVVGGKEWEREKEILSLHSQKAYIDKAVGVLESVIWGGDASQEERKRREELLQEKEKINQKLKDFSSPRYTLTDTGTASSALITRDADFDKGGIDLNAIKMELKNYASSPLEQKKEFIGKFKTLLCIDALLDKKWFSLAHLYFQEIIRLVKDKIVSELDRDKLLSAASALKAKGYLIDRQGLEFLKLLEAGKPIAEIRFLLSP